MNTLLDTIPAPEYEEGHPLQAHVTNLDASPYVGRLAICRVRNGTIKKGQQIAWCRARRHDHLLPRLGALHHRGARPRRRRRGRPGRDHRRRRHARRHDRRDAGRSRGPAPAAADQRRRAVDQRHHRHQPLAAGRAGRRQADRPPDPGPADRGDDRQRLDPRAADRAPGHLGGPGPRRAPAGDPRRDHAPRGLRAHRRQAAGGHPRDRRRAPRAGRADDDRRARGVRRRDHADARAAPGPDGADDQPRHGLGPDGLPGPGARADRLPHRVPHRHARHRPAAPRLRALGAVGGRHAPAPDRRRWSPTAAARRPPSRCSTCRSAGRCSSSPARTSTRA